MYHFNMSMTLKDWMDEKGETAVTMALKLGVTKGQVHHILNGTRKYSKFLALKIEQVTKGKVVATDLNEDARL